MKMEDRLADYLGDRELAILVAPKIGDTPVASTEVKGCLKVEVKGVTYHIPWDVYDPNTNF